VATLNRARIGQPERQPERAVIWFSKPLIQLSRFAMKWPRRALALLVIASFVILLGMRWVSTDDALENFLRARTPDYQAFERLRERFPASELDVFVTVEGKDLFAKSNLDHMRELNFALLFSDSVSSVVSILSLREPLKESGVPGPLLPETAEDTPDEAGHLLSKALSHPLASGRLLSPVANDGSQLALFVVGLDAAKARQYGLPQVVGELRTIAGEVEQGGPLRIGVAGVPAMKSEVIEGSRRDLVLFNGIGILVGTFICTMVFWHTRLVLLANVAPILALLWCIGLFGWTGTRIDPLLNAVLPMILVMTFNDSIHFVLAICRYLDDGIEKGEAISRAIADIGPACALTSVATAIALFSLPFSSSPLIQTFGLWGGICTFIALALVMVMMPSLAALFLETGQSYLGGRNPYAGVQMLDRLSGRLAGFIGRYAAPITIAGCLATVLAAVNYLQLEPRYKLSDMLPDQGEVSRVTQKIEDRLGSLFPVNVMVEWPAGFEPKSPEVMHVIASVHNVLANNKAITKVNSLKDLQDWAESGGLRRDVASARMLDTVPEPVLARFLEEKHRSALITGYLPNYDSRRTLAIAEALEAALAPIRSQHPDFDITLTGLSVVAASRSTDVISQLNVSMIGAIVVVTAIIGIAFGSMRMAAYSALPNLFGLFATGAWLYFAHGGLEYATVVGLTVAFGLAVDDTIHLLNRYQLEKSTAFSIPAAIGRTLRFIGTVLIISTVILVMGIAVTQFSSLPPTREFGLICMVTLVFALLGDLVFLPALMLLSETALRRRDLSARLAALVPTRLSVWIGRRSK
jgi:predicted RND superfamily exporter protein